MSKKEKTRRKVFGLVSKLGSFIKKGGGANTSNDNMDTSAGENETPKKSFNIHISEDNQEEIEIADDEEEEEEEEEDEPKQETKKDLSNNEEDKDKDIIGQKEKNNNDDNILEKKDNNDLENITNNQINSKSNDEEIKKENNIENDSEKNTIKNIPQKDLKYDSNNINLNKENININDNKKEKSPKEVNNIQIKEEEKDNIKKENIIENINEVCHLYLKAGNDFNSKEIYCIPITQIKNRKKKSIFQKMNVFKKVKNEVINFKIFFEENFIYFAKDIIVDKKNKDLRRISKVYNIRNISNYISNKDLESNKYKIEYEIMNKKLVTKSKEYFIEEEYYKEFNDEMNKKLKLFSYSDKNHNK